MKIKSVLFVAAVMAIATLTSCGGSKKGGLPNFSDDGKLLYEASDLIYHLVVPPSLARMPPTS